ncbi:MAG: DUF308 domain-containing protein [Cetobacterium sp.]
MKLNFKSFFLTLGIFYVLIGALGISNMGFFNKNIEYILSTILFLNGAYHIFYSTSNRKSPYFHWGLVLAEGIIELISVAIILLNTFTSQLFFTSYIGILLCLKGLILVLGRDNKFTSWEKTKAKVRVLVIVKGLLHFLFGSLILILPLLADKAVYVVFGWYILFLGIHFLTEEYMSNKKSDEI